MTAATQFNEPVHVLVSSSDPSAIADAASKTQGVDKVLVAKDD